MKRLYKFLQEGLGVQAMYEDLLEYPGSENLLVAGRIDSLSFYTPTDENQEVRKSMLRKIMARYYNYNLFTDDSSYFAHRMYWKLNQIMPTYAARFNSTMTSGEYDALIEGGLITTTNRNMNGTDNGTASNSSNSSNTMTRGTKTVVKNTGTQKDVGSNQSFFSDYPQVIVGSNTDYNATGTKNTDSMTRTDDLTQEQNVSGADTDAYNQTGTNSHNITKQETANESRKRNFTPYEIALAKEKFAKLVYNIEEEIVNAVSDLFVNVSVCEDEEPSVEQMLAVLAPIPVSLQKLTDRVAAIDFTDEELYNISLVPQLFARIDTINTRTSELQEEVNLLHVNTLPDVTEADVNKILMVSEEGKWATTTINFANGEDF